MTGSAVRAESKGYVATTVGGLLGGAVGILVGVPVANANATGSIEGVATALIILFLSLCVSTAIGAGLAVRIVRQRRPVVTAVVAVPVMFVVSYAAAIVATRGTDTAFLLVPAIILGSIVALMVSRWLALIGTGRAS
jgi:hypothetical protein